jgi:tetratricopeptide (TPR) repeat protein
MTVSRAECGARTRRRTPWIGGLLLLTLGAAGCATRPPAPEFYRAVRPLDAEGAYLRAVPFYPAQEEQAHAAVLAMVTDYWQPPGRFARVRPRWRDHRIDLAAPDGQLETYLRERGLWGYWGEGRWEHIAARLRAEVPVIVTLQERPLDRSTLSLALVTGYDDVRRRVLLYGLGERPEEMAYAGFSNRWRHAQYRLLSVCPPERAVWEMTNSERVSRGRYYMARGLFKEAARDFEAALERRPGEAIYYVELADACFLQHAYDEAEQLYRTALTLDDLNARAMNNLAYLLIQSGGDLQEAIKWARNATAREPDNPKLLDTLGVALHRTGDYREAARILERARTRAMHLDGETQAVIAMHLVQVYHDDNLWHLARQTLADALSHNPRVEVPPDLRIHLRPTQTVRRR